MKLGSTTPSAVKPPRVSWKPSLRDLLNINCHHSLLIVCSRPPMHVGASLNLYHHNSLKYNSMFTPCSGPENAHDPHSFKIGHLSHWKHAILSALERPRMGSPENFCRMHISTGFKERSRRALGMDDSKFLLKQAEIVSA